jgi:drug resistance transporter, EmrB/QacA subfamily
MKTNRQIVTISVFIATFMTAIEGTIVSTAMPTIVGSLKGIEIMNWVFAIYLLTNAMLTPIYGKLSDKVGRKPIFMIGILIFIIGSSLCGLANTMLTLILARAIQGIGAGAIMPVALTILADLYDLDKRARMLGLNSAAWGIASIFGPLAGGFIVDTVGWHWIFFINVPIGIILLGLIVFFFNEEKRLADTKKMDIKGSLALMLVLLSLLLGFQLLGDHGFNSSVALSFGGFLLFLGLFIWLEGRAEDPVIDLSLFKNRAFVLVNLIAALLSGFLMGIDVYVPMWMQGVLGKSAALGGIVLAPMSVIWMGGSFLAGRLLTKVGMQRSISLGLLILIVGGTWLVMLPTVVAYGWFFIIASVLGLGFGLAITTTTVTAQSSVSPERLGVATSFNTLVRTIGQTVMISLFGVLLNQTMADKLAADPKLAGHEELLNQLVNPHTAQAITADLLGPLRNILHSGLQTVFLVGLGLVVASFILSLFLPKKDSALS